MSKVIFDIETSGVDFDSLDKERKEYLLKFAETDEEKEEAKQRLALYALTAEVVAIGMLNPETNKGVVYYQNNNGEAEEFTEDNILYKSGTEKEVLEYFWEAMKSYGQFITFNGRGFDCPFLMTRSAILEVKPTKNLMPYRFSTDVHIDLLEQLSWQGAIRKFSLDFFCKAFDIKSPKNNGITGLDVPVLYKEGKYQDIAKYCFGDLVATKDLYDRWNEFINIK
jgi:3'-5' exonuclease